MTTMFHEFYQHIYSQRWEALLEALQKPNLQVARFNGFLENDGESTKIVPSELGLRNCAGPQALSQQELTSRRNDLLPYYVMDPASVLAARLLPVEEGMKVLDMCAAPGGKSLILAEALNGTGELWCNELSMERRGRLKKVLQQYIPQEKRMQTWIKGADGIKFGLKNPNEFDAILLDAPCSGEAHLIQDQAQFKKWTPNWTKKNASRQYALISSAYLALKPGGFLLYSTCTLSPVENEQVIEKILNRRNDLVAVESEDEIRELLQKQPDSENMLLMIRKYGERQKYGFMFCPDHCGFGPFYFCLLKKT